MSVTIIVFHSNAYGIVLLISAAIKIPDFSSSYGSTLELLDARMELLHELHRTVMEVESLLDNTLSRFQRAQIHLNDANSSLQRTRLRNRRVIQHSVQPGGNYSYTSESLLHRLNRVNDPTVRRETECWSAVDSNVEIEREFKDYKVLEIDEAWLYYYDPTIKQQSSEWKHPSSPTLKKAKTMKSAVLLLTDQPSYFENNFRSMCKGWGSTKTLSSSRGSRKHFPVIVVQRKHSPVLGVPGKPFQVLGVPSDLYFVFKVAIEENPDSQRYDVENVNSIRNDFVFSAKNSTTTSIQNSKSALLQNCLLISSLDVKSRRRSLFRQLRDLLKYVKWIPKPFVTCYQFALVCVLLDAL
ncbi:hypothetical protein TNCV_4832901 [Trichonephila clavipes]|nr:hypothetical protein TNCV_4832901 [Trichonephila clavipes]